MLGNAATTVDEILRHLKLAHIALKTLIQTFAARAPLGRELAIQVPRSDNSAADAAANRALDQGSFTEIRVKQISSFLAQLCSGNGSFGLLFAFDGAARGNPGPSSSGVCAWWGSFQADGFTSHGIILQKGCRLGCGSNTSAEAHGLSTAVKIALHYHYWLIQQLSQLTRHTETDIQEII